MAMNIENCPDCGGTHFGSNECPIKQPQRQRQEKGRHRHREAAAKEVDARGPNIAVPRRGVLPPDTEVDYRPDRLN